MFKVLLYFFYLFLPFSFALNPIETVDLPIARVIVIALFLGWLAGALLKKQIEVRALGVLSLFLFWLLWSTLSVLWALDPTWSMRKIVFLLNIGLLFPILVTLTQETLAKVSQAFVIGAVGIALVACVEASLQFFLPLENILTLWNTRVLPVFLGNNFSLVVTEYSSLLVNILGTTYLRATAFFPDPHTLSLYLGLALPLVFIWQQRTKTLVARVSLGVVVIAILLTFSRGAYVALLLTYGGLLLMLLAKNPHRYGKYFLVGIMLLGGVFLGTPIGPRILSSVATEDGSRIERLRLLDEALQASFERPLLGVGIGNYPLLVKPDAGFREPIYVHNLYLDIVVETGFIGLLLFLSFIGSSVWLGWRKWQQYQDPLTLACGTGIVYFLFHGFFEAPLFSFHVMFALFLLLAYQAVPRTKTV